MLSDDTFQYIIRWYPICNRNALDKYVYLMRLHTSLDANLSELYFEMNFIFLLHIFLQKYIREKLTWEVFLHMNAMFSSLAFFHFSLLFWIIPRVSLKCLVLNFVCKLGKFVSINKCKS